MKACVCAVAVLLATVEPAGADNPSAGSLFCVFPQSQPLPECFKGSSISEEAVHQCYERNKRRKKVPPRVRINKGPWVEFSGTTWRCLPAPVGKSFTYHIENHGTPFYSDRMTIPTTPCATGRVDLTRPNFYGSMWANCSKRKNTAKDDVVTP
ncbi:MAG TPA: hypothetical protein VM513_28440 [Kofleriaceae bacterium]|nr:hypothetical protein [Kofleriaceae bacterium]